MEENRTEMMEMNEVETEDVKEGLDVRDFIGVGLIMAAGAGAYAGGKKAYHLIKEKAIPAAKRKFGKDKNSDVKMVPEHEGSKKKSKKSKVKESEAEEAAEK